MLRFVRSKKGVSILEVIVGIAVIGVISVPITMMYVNSLKTSRMTMSEMEDNAVVWIVKENIKEAVKTGAVVYGNEGEPADVSDDRRLIDGTGNPCAQYGLKVADSNNGLAYEAYCFDAVPLLNDPYPGLAKWMVVIYKTDQGILREVRKFRFEMNFLPIENTGHLGAGSG